MARPKHKPNPLQAAFLADVLRERDEQGLPHKEFHRRSGVSQPHWSDLTRGRRNLTLRVIMRIAKALKRTPKIILTNHNA